MIRTARAEDLARLLAIETAAAERFRGTAMAFVLDAPPTSADGYGEALESGLLFVADLEGEAAGFLAAREMPGALHILEVSVHPDCGRRGLARALIAHAANVALGLQLPLLSLTTDRDIAWNGPLWAKLGFRETDCPPEWLATILLAERDAGFDPARRVAMLRAT